MSSKGKILVVDDEEDILEIVRYNLEREGYSVTCVESGEEGITQARTFLPDLIVLDLMLPGMDGLNVCKVLKKDSKTASIPIIMLTAKGEESDIVSGLEMGADDYMAKPFSPKILIARVRSLLRRVMENDEIPSGDVLKRGNLVIDSSRREAKLNGKELNLTFSEFEMLKLLARRPGWVYTRSQIVNETKGSDYPVTERAIDVQIVGLRKKLGKFGDMVETVRGVGYRFNGNQR